MSSPVSAKIVAPDQKLADLKTMIKGWSRRAEDFDDAFERLDKSGKVNSANETQSTALNVN